MTEEAFLSMLEMLIDAKIKLASSSRGFTFDEPAYEELRLVRATFIKNMKEATQQ